MRCTPDCSRGTKLKERNSYNCAYGQWYNGNDKGMAKADGMGIETNTIDNVHLEGINSAWLAPRFLQLTNAPTRRQMALGD